MPGHSSHEIFENGKKIFDKYNGQNWILGLLQVIKLCFGN